MVMPKLTPCLQTKKTLSMQNNSTIHPVLVVDAATEACSVCLQTQSGIFSRFEVCPQQHSQRILPMIHAVCAEAQIKIQDVKLIGFGRGPGSFTGVRIAIATMQGLAFGLNVPVVGVSTLAAMAQQVIEQSVADDVLVAIDARMSEVYFAHYQKQADHIKLVGNERVISPQMAAEYVQKHTQSAVAGTGWQAYPELAAMLNPESVIDVQLPDARYMLPAVVRAYEAGQAVPVEDAQPVYLRDTVTWKKLPGRE